MTKPIFTAGDGETSLEDHPNTKHWPQSGRDWVRFIRELSSQRAAKTFTPTWTGFSSDPSGDLKYFFIGPLAVIWSDSVLSGTSDSASFSLSGVPSIIRPETSQRRTFVAINEGTQLLAVASVDSAGDITFHKLQTAVESTSGDTVIRFISDQWTASGSKGIQNLTLVYSLV